MKRSPVSRYMNFGVAVMVGLITIGGVAGSLYISRAGEMLLPSEAVFTIVLLPLMLVICPTQADAA